jgi:hypothetical protein
MSKIQITGPSTGTGTLTLTSTATNTNQTITFPNTTATLIAVDPGTASNVLTSNGTAWVSQAAAAGGGDYIMQVFVGPSTGTWTKPAGLKAIKVTVIGGGGSSGGAPNSGAGGGGGGTAIEYIDAPALPGPQPYTAGGGGAVPSPSTAGQTGGTSSFGSPAFLSATGGAGGNVGISPTSAGGAGSGGQLNIGGGTGFFAPIACGNNMIVGGGSVLGNNGFLFGNGGNPAFPASDRGYGAGAIAYTVPTSAGKLGGPGVVIVEEFY